MRSFWPVCAQAARYPDQVHRSEGCPSVLAQRQREAAHLKSMEQPPQVGAAWAAVGLCRHRAGSTPGWPRVCPLHCSPPYSRVRGGYGETWRGVEPSNAPAERVDRKEMRALSKTPCVKSPTIPCVNSVKELISVNSVYDVFELRSGSPGTALPHNSLAFLGRTL